MRASTRGLPFQNVMGIMFSTRGEAEPVPQVAGNVQCWSPPRRIAARGDRENRNGDRPVQEPKDSEGTGTAGFDGCDDAGDRDAFATGIRLSADRGITWDTA